MPRALGNWALDSGGFSELTLFGEWKTSPAEYVNLVRRYNDEIGQMQWAAVQDWMCEPFVLAKTRKTVAEHQQLTIDSYLYLSEKLPEVYFLPVLQGWKLMDYLRHIDMYAERGVDLTALKLVGIGSVCRRQATSEIARILSAVECEGIRLHGFGVKKQGLQKAAQHLASADSMAWSFCARRDNPLPECSHPNCANCLRYAVKWYWDIRGTIDESLSSWSDTSMLGRGSYGLAGAC